jgi:hypothetical protein
MELFLVVSLFAALFVMLGAVVDDFAPRSRHQRLPTLKAQMPDCEPPPRERVPHELEEKLPYDEAA